jgi:thioesterase domain-containing protein
VRDELQVALPVHALMQRATFNALVDHVRELRQDGELPMVDGALPREGGELVVQLQAGESTHLPLFLIQPIGGTVYTYAPLVQHLDPKLPVYGVRASGMEPGEPILSDLPTIMAAYLRNIRSVQPCGPYVLGGHSAGGVIAFALAEQLIEEGQKVQGVFLIDSPSQEEIQRTAGLSVAQLLNELGNAADSQSEGQLGLAAALREETPFRAIALGTLSALAAYPLRALPVDLTYILAKDEPAGPEGPAGNDAQRARFWMEKTDHDFRLHKVAGTHFTMMEPPLVGAIAERLHEGLLGSRAIAATAVPHKRDT